MFDTNKSTFQYALKPTYANFDRAVSPSKFLCYFI